MSVYDIMLAKQPGGDPTMPVPISGAPATTYNNPGFRDGRPINGNSFPNNSEWYNLNR